MKHQITPEPRGLSRIQAATYIGVSPSMFDKMVEDGRMPTPTRINTRRVWDRIKVDDAFTSLSNDEERNPWDE